jgi:hypothetical protein
VFYLLTFGTGITALLVRGQAGAVAGLTAAACYAVVTVLFYLLFAPVNRALSAAAAVVSLAGIVVGPLGLKGVHPLVFFGVYCLLIAYLIGRSTFLPRVLSALMALASVGWLTFLSPSFAGSLYPYNLAPGIVGEGALTLWLLVCGVNGPKWEQQGRARTAKASPNRG